MRYSASPAMKYQVESGSASRETAGVPATGPSAAAAPHTQQKTTTLRYVSPVATTARKTR
jgi:hypothetical protein